MVSKMRFQENWLCFIFTLCTSMMSWKPSSNMCKKFKKVGRETFRVAGCQSVCHLVWQKQKQKQKKRGHINGVNASSLYNIPSGWIWVVRMSQSSASVSDETVTVALNHCNYSSAGFYPQLRFTLLKTSPYCATVNVAVENRNIWLWSNGYPSVLLHLYGGSMWRCWAE